MEGPSGAGQRLDYISMDNRILEPNPGDMGDSFPLKACFKFGVSPSSINWS